MTIGDMADMEIIHLISLTLEPEDNDDDFQVWILFHGFMFSLHGLFSGVQRIWLPTMSHCIKGTFLNPLIGSKY